MSCNLERRYLHASDGHVRSGLRGRRGCARQPAGAYGFLIALPAADQRALKAITTTAADAHGYLSLTVAGRTWLLAKVMAPFAGRPEIAFPGRSRALQLQRLLVPSG